MSDLEKQEVRYWKLSGVNVPNFLINEEFIKNITDYHFVCRKLIEKNITKKEFKNILKILKKDKDLANALMKIYLMNNKYTGAFSDEFINKYGRDFIVNYSEIFAKIENDLSELIPFLSTNKCDEKIKQFLISKSENIRYLINLGLSPEIILNNIDSFDDIMSICKQNFTFDKTFVNNINSMQNHEILKYIYNIKSIVTILSNLKDEGFDDYTKKDLKDFIISNSNINIPKECFEYIENIKTIPNGNKIYTFLGYNSEIPFSFKREFMEYMISKETNVDRLKRFFMYNQLGVYFTSDSDLIECIEDVVKANVIEDENVKKYLDVYTKIKNASSKEELMNLKNINVLELKQEVIEKAILFRNKEINDRLFDPNALTESDEVSISYETLEDGKQIKFVTLHNVPFVMLSHNIIEWQHLHNGGGLGSPNAELADKLVEQPDLWLDNDEGTKYISMSLNNQRRCKTFGKSKITLGFSHIGDTQIKAASTGDRGTPTERGYKMDNTLNFESVDTLLDHGDNWNELVSDREGILPDYLIVSDKNTKAGFPQLDDNIKRWASYYNIPIVVIDTNSYFKQAYKEYLMFLEIIKHKETIPTTEELKKLDDYRKAIDSFSSYSIQYISEYEMIMEALNIKDKNLSKEEADFLINFIQSKFMNNVGEVVNFGFSEHEYIKAQEAHPGLSYVELDSVLRKQRESEILQMCESLKEVSQRFDQEETMLGKRGMITIPFIVVGTIIMGVIIACAFLKF